MTRRDHERSWRLQQQRLGCQWRGMPLRQRLLMVLLLGSEIPQVVVLLDQAVVLALIWSCRMSTERYHAAGRVARQLGHVVEKG